MWTPKYPDGCVECGGSERVHRGQGYCSRCYFRAQQRGDLIPAKRFSKRRVRHGTLQFYCYTCRAWKGETEFWQQRRVMCAVCRRQEHKRDYHRRWDVIQERRQRRHAERNREARKAHRRHATKKDVWGTNHGVVELEPVLAWMEELRQRVLMKTTTNAVGQKTPLNQVGDGWSQMAHECGLGARQVYRMRKESGLVSFDVAEKVALAADKMPELYELLRVGKPGWSKHSDYCLRCGIYDAPHHALGYCLRCYSAHRNARDTGRAMTLPMRERWSIRHAQCRRCRGVKVRHRGRGLCIRCYDRLLTAAKREGTRTGEYMDRLGYLADYPYNKGRLNGQARAHDA